MIPYDLDAETDMLGAMLLSRAAVEVGVTMLVPEDFYKPVHARMFEACCHLWRHGKSCDPTTVAATMHELAGTDPDVPGGGSRRSQLLEIQAHTPASANAHHYAETIIERADRRRLLTLSGDILASVQDLTVPIDETVQAARAGLDVVLRAGGNATFPPFAEWALGVNMTESWIVPDMLERRDRVLVVAPEGFGKSHLLRQWGLMCACGIHWFTERPMTRSKVLIIDVENSPRQIVRNTTDMYRLADQKAPGWNPENFVIIPFGSLDLNQRSDRLNVEAYLAGHRPDVLIIGPLYKVFSSDSRRTYEENALRATGVIDDWRARFDVAVLIEHHAPKGSGGRRDFDPLGSSAWLRWPEYGIRLEPSEDNPREAKLGHFRGQRERRPWPQILERGGPGAWGWRVPFGSTEERF